MLLFIYLSVTEFCISGQTIVLMTVRQFICIMLVLDVGSAWLTSIGGNVRAGSTLAATGIWQPFWMMDRRWFMRTPHAVEVELYKPPPFLMRIVGASLQSQNPSLPPSSFLIGNRWLRWMFRQEGERNGRLKSKWVVQLWWIPKWMTPSAEWSVLMTSSSLTANDC